MKKQLKGWKLVLSIQGHLYNKEHELREEPKVVVLQKILSDQAT